MPTPTYLSLATLTLTSASATVTFSSIPATFRDLIVVCNFSGSTAAQMILRFNGDTGANYSGVFMSGSPSGAVSGTLTNFFTNIRTSQNATILQVMDYSATNKHKTTLIRANNGDFGEVAAQATRYASNSAITSVALLTNAGTISIGSTFSLYGVN